MFNNSFIEQGRFMFFAIIWYISGFAAIYAVAGACAVACNCPTNDEILEASLAYSFDKGPRVPMNYNQSTEDFAALDQVMAWCR